MSILVVGGDSAEVFRQRAAARQRHVEHWSGRKTRHAGKAIPKDTEAVVVVLDRVSHALAKKVRSEATRRGLPVFFQRRGRQIDSTDAHSSDLTQWLDRDSNCSDLTNADNLMTNTVHVNHRTASLKERIARRR